MKKRLASDIILSELLWCGGEQKTRKQLQDELLAEGHEKRYVDWYLFCLANHQQGAREVSEGQLPRDTQFAGFAERLWEELEDKGEFNIDMASRDSDDIVRLIIARRAYDLVHHTLSHAGDEDTGSWEHTISTIPDMTERPNGLRIQNDQVSPPAHHQSI